MQTRSHAKKESSRDDSPKREHAKRDKEAAASLKQIGEVHGTEAVDLTARLFYYHVHINGQYRLSLPSKDSALAYMKRLVHKHNPDDESGFHVGRNNITYIGADGVTPMIQALNLTPQLAHLFPKPLVLPGPCAGGECDTVVAPYLDEECTADGCRELLCQVCCGKKTCAQHSDTKK